MADEQSRVLNIQINAPRCTGCRACELACSFIREGIFAPGLSRIRIMKLHDLGVNVPIVCSNCAEAPCIPACPTGAILRDDSVPVIRVNEEDCTGCGACVEECPFGAIELNPERQVAMMCDLCDGKPACVDHCVYGVLSLSRTTTTAQPCADHVGGAASSARTMTTSQLKRLARARVVATEHRVQ